MEELTRYKNFWLVWMSAAGNKEGISLFMIQKEWGITTNYLYHHERRLKKPLFKAMIDEQYLEKSGRNLKARFDWIPDYILKKRRMSLSDQWSPNFQVIEKWALIQRFLEKSSPALFAMKNLKVLYKNTDSIKKTGQFIFDDLYLFVLIYNIMPFCRKYKADIVTRIMYTIVSMASERNLLAYFQEVSRAGITIPLIVRDESTLDEILCPLLGIR